MVSSKFQALSSKTTHGSNSTIIGELNELRTKIGEFWRFDYIL